MLGQRNGTNRLLIADLNATRFAVLKVVLIFLSGNISVKGPGGIAAFMFISECEDSVAYQISRLMQSPGQ